MEKYTDLKFEGDLSFLNESLEAAINAINEAKTEEVKKEPIYKLVVPKPKKEKEILQDAENKQNTEIRENTENTENTENSQYMQNDNNLQSVNNLQNTENSQYMQNDNDLQNTANMQNTENMQNTANMQNTENMKHMQNAENMQYMQNAEYMQNAINLQNAENMQYMQNAEYMQNAINLQNAENMQYVENTKNTEKFNDLNINRNNYSDIRTENNTTLKSYKEKSVHEVHPTLGERKSQLELMVLNSGYDLEMFNNLKIELLELEKDKIIMKYKQDLMMMILKS